MSPKVLLLTTCRWYSAARLAIAFSATGCDVEMVCPQDHPVERTSSVLCRHPYHGLMPLKSFRSAILLAKPDLLVPCDELATIHLHAMHAQTVGKGAQTDKHAEEIRVLIEQSLGNAENFVALGARSRIMEIAREQGVHVPETAMIDSLAALREWLVQHGFPSMLKSDGTSGGVGVKTIFNFEDAVIGFEKLAAPPRSARVLKRAVMDRDFTLIRPWALRKTVVVNIQRFVAGREATSAVSCWKGRTLASIHVEVLRTWQEKGPASVVQRIENDGINRAVESMVSRLGLSGLYGFDFILEEGSGIPYLIEINPRATQTSHLGLGEDHDPAAALFAVLAGATTVRSRTVTDNDVIALFPQEWQSNASSQYLRSAYHDVPWDEPDLVRLCIADPARRRHWYSARRPQQLSTRALVRWR